MRQETHQNRQNLIFPIELFEWAVKLDSLIAKEERPGEGNKRAIYRWGREGS